MSPFSDRLFGASFVAPDPAPAETITLQTIEFEIGGLTDAQLFHFCSMVTTRAAGALKDIEIEDDPLRGRVVRLKADPSRGILSFDPDCMAQVKSAGDALAGEYEAKRAELERDEPIPTEESLTQALREGRFELPDELKKAAGWER